MKKLLVILPLLFPVLAVADKPAFYDYECARNLQSNTVKSPTGNYSFNVFESDEKCKLHGTYYQVVVKSGNPATGNQATWRYSFTDVNKAMVFLLNEQRQVAKWADRPHFYTSAEMVEIKY